MAKRRSLSYLLIKFVLTNGLVIVLLIFAWFLNLWLGIDIGLLYPANHDEQAVQLFVKEQKNKHSFVSSQVPNNVAYALFNGKKKVLQTNTSKADQKKMQQYLQHPRQTDYGYQLVRYPDKSVVVLHYHYLTRYVDPNLQKILPPWEYFSLGITLFLVLLCLFMTTFFLKKKIVKSLTLFQQVGENIARQNLDFQIPQSDIKEFEHALTAMTAMQAALKESLTSKWAQEQSQRQEISALSHDLKTPLTVIHGNSELLLEDDNLTKQQREDLQSIIRNAKQANEYLDSLQTATNGTEEQAVTVNLNNLQREISQQARELVRIKKINLQIEGELQGYAYLQKEHFVRAVINIIANAITYTSIESKIGLYFVDNKQTIEISVHDSGPGFSKEALTNATKRFWKEDQARALNGHSGLGLWFANVVVQNNGGSLLIKNGSQGGIVTVVIKKVAKT
ncbi:HAMP domain-containing sensor histidine kinase [Lactobacillus sp. ESL0791]|uniref:sensor histidine kinase n=1 Tax=Lactobacillus sp. ESL0791 TaxID=2983234 RepID=UPI0023F9C5A6|nr:HAMP domain-containing sensor histidine kinase [Lactobacillus sp. ESL0791]MDF7639817.1 HAMP domain-containing sensor histidine kinase [Lactobacillus sp. ESL0791]